MSILCHPMYQDWDSWPTCSQFSGSVFTSTLPVQSMKKNEYMVPLEKVKTVCEHMFQSAKLSDWRRDTKDANSDCPAVYQWSPSSHRPKQQQITAAARQQQHCSLAYSPAGTTGQLPRYCTSQNPQLLTRLLPPVWHRTRQLSFQYALLHYSTQWMQTNVINWCTIPKDDTETVIVIAAAILRKCKPV